MLDVRTPLLAVKDLQAWYGESHILHGVSFDVHQGEVVTLLGRNGAGKTTTLKSIMGIVGQRTGSVRFETRELIGLASNQIARAGIALCPEERGIFASLTVEENLMLPPVVKQGGLPLEATRRLNETRKITIHVIGVGKETDPDFLKKLAEQNRGQYIAR